MWGLFLQCVLSLLPIGVAYYEKLKEFRKRENAPKKEAKIALIFIIAASILSIGFQINNYIDIHREQENLNNRFNKLDIKNDSLENRISKDAKSLSGHLDYATLKLSDQAADKALQASKELKSTADSIKKIIKGSDIPPTIELTKGPKMPTFQFKNHDNLPVTFMCAIQNYSNLEKCSISGNSIDFNCYMSNKQDFAVTLNPNIPFLFSIPNCPTSYKVDDKFKIMVSISLGEKHYNIYGMVVTIGTEISYCSITYRVDEHRNRHVYSIYNPNKLNVNFDQEFPSKYETLPIQ